MFFYSSLDAGKYLVVCSHTANYFVLLFHYAQAYFSYEEYLIQATRPLSYNINSNLKIIYIVCSVFFIRNFFRYYVCQDFILDLRAQNYTSEFLLLWQLNPFPPSVPIWHRLAKLSILILEGIVKKISYERRDYESVDEKNLS